jgi:hypothetical protein
MERSDLHGDRSPPPTPEEFEEARQRELARLNVRTSSIKGQAYHTPEDSKLLEGDTADRRLADMATVRRWNENCSRHGGGEKRPKGQTARRTRASG